MQHASIVTNSYATVALNAMPGFSPSAALRLPALVCRFAQDASFIMNSNDPAGFNIIDVLAYGALGHALGFFLLGASSLWEAGTKPTPF